MIEEAIAKLTAAVQENTAAIREVLLAGGTDTPTPVADEPKPAPKKKAVVEVKTPEPAAEPKAADPSETTEPVAPTESKFTIVEAIEASKKFLAADRDTNKPKLEALRAKFGIATVKDLAEDQINAYMAELAKL